MEMEDGHISPSKVAQKHICAPSNGRYPVSNAFELFDKATSYGFGNIIDVMTPSKRRVKKFRKTPYDCLPPRSLELLRKLKITNDEYQKTFRTTSSIIPTPSLLNDDTDHLPPSDLRLSLTCKVLHYRSQMTVFALSRAHTPPSHERVGSGHDTMLHGTILHSCMLLTSKLYNISYYKI